MQDKQQFEQLMMQYEQLKNRAIEISSMIDNEDYDSAITMIKTREDIFLSCKCIRRYLEMTPEQEKQLNSILDEIKKLEQGNIEKLKANMEVVQEELAKTQKSQKIHQAYKRDDNAAGSMINFQE